MVLCSTSHILQEKIKLHESNVKTLRSIMKAKVYIISKETDDISICTHAVHVIILCEKVSLSEQVYFMSKHSLATAACSCHRRTML